jgi:hypothetical protein
MQARCLSCLTPASGASMPVAVAKLTPAERGPAHASDTAALVALFWLVQRPSALGG